MSVTTGSRPLTGSWKIRELGSRDHDHALEFLERRPLHNVFLISRIIDDGLDVAQPLLQLSRGGQPVLLASTGANLVVAADASELDEELDIALRVLAARILDRYMPVRAIISEAHLVAPLWDELRLSVEAPTVIRFNQPVMALSPAGPIGLPDLSSVRYGRLDELEELVIACAAMHREEVGIDPLVRDPWGYRQRIRELIERRRSFVLRDERGIRFKCELSAESPSAVQIMGVWTRPDARRCGVGRSAMAEVTGHLLRQGRWVTLFVNDFNAPAISLYRRLGYREIGTNRAIIW